MAVIGFKSGARVIDVCLSFNVAVVFSPAYFCSRHARALLRFELDRRWRFRSDRDGKRGGDGI
jgi:hypothetical protein